MATTDGAATGDPAIYLQTQIAQMLVNQQQLHTRLVETETRALRADTVLRYAKHNGGDRRDYRSVDTRGFGKPRKFRSERERW